MARARPIEEVLRDASASSDIKNKLIAAQAMRRFASVELSLPDNDSYKEYVDLQRPYAVWNVFAAPELSLQPRKWCFLVVGCVSYRGYYKKTRAESFADEQRAAGDDVYVGGVAAYSTLGWFDDPILNTVMHYDEVDLAGLMFHELAHQVVYVKNDSKFNESFATTVELEGVRRWLAARGEDSDAYQRRKTRRQRVIDLILQHRSRLENVYAADQEDDWKRKQKQALLEELKDRFNGLTRDWEGIAGFRRWFNEPLNNAKLLSIATYYDYVPAFQALLLEQKQDLPGFYRAVSELAERAPEQRQLRLKQLAP